MVDAAGSRRALSRILGVVDGTIMNWERNEATPQPITQARIAELTGISGDWLVNGKGDERAELEKLRKKLGENSDSGVGRGARIAEDAGQYSVPMHSLSSPTSTERAMELAAAKLNAAELANLIETVLNDSKMNLGDRRSAAMRLAMMLLNKLDRERGQSEHGHS